MASVRIEEKYEQVRHLISLGRERGYLVYDELNEALPEEIATSVEDIEDLYEALGNHGIEVVDSEEEWRERQESKGLLAKAESVKGEAKLELDTGTLEKTNDPVRMYLREMGTVPLLTREGEVAIAKRIERGQLVVLKTITRSPIVLKEMLAIGEELRKGTRSIKEIVQFDDEELTEEKIENKTRQVLKIIDKIEKLYQIALKQAAKLESTPKSKKRDLWAKYALARTRIQMSQLVRSIEFNPREKKRLIDKMRHTVKRLHSLEREAGRLEHRADAAKGETAAEARKDLRSCRTELKEIEESSEVGFTELKRTLQQILRGEAQAEQAKKELTV